MLDASEFLVCSVVITHVFLTFQTRCLHNRFMGKVPCERLHLSRMTAEVIKAFSTTPESGASSGKALLTDRELEVTQQVAQDFHNKEIGKRLFISEQTVKNHLHNISDKLGVSDRLELMLYAIHHRLIDKPDETLAPRPISAKADK
jgi:DNA-binding CsgD family transcriptional regulator